MTEYITCQCKTEGLTLEVDPDLNMVFLSMFYIGRPGNMTFTQKLRLIWRVITCGHGYTDQLILAEPEVAKLIKILKQYHEQLPVATKE